MSRIKAIAICSAVFGAPTVAVADLVQVHYSGGFATLSVFAPEDAPFECAYGAEPALIELAPDAVAQVFARFPSAFAHEVDPPTTTIIIRRGDERTEQAIDGTSFGFEQAFVPRDADPVEPAPVDWSVAPVMEVWACAGPASLYIVDRSLSLWQTMGLFEAHAEVFPGELGDEVRLVNGTMNMAYQAALGRETFVSEVPQRPGFRQQQMGSTRYLYDQLLGQLTVSARLPDIAYARESDGAVVEANLRLVLDLYLVTGLREAE